MNRTLLVNGFLELYHFKGWGLQIQVVPAYKCKQFRGWKERWFTLPWRPFTKYKETYVEWIEDGQVLYNQDRILCNQTTYNEFIKYYQEKYHE